MEKIGGPLTTKCSGAKNEQNSQYYLQKKKAEQKTWLSRIELQD